MDEAKELTEKAVSDIMKSYGNNPQQLIAILLDIQSASGRNYVDRKWAESVSAVLDVPLSKIYDILTFYAMFSVTPRGHFVIEICQSAPCHFSKANEVAGWFEAAAGIKVGQTTEDGMITLSGTSCVGACDSGPAVKIGDHIFGNLNEEKAAFLVKCCREDNIKEAVQLCLN